MRPQRQTRSSVCYAENDSDEDFTAAPPPAARRRQQPERECSKSSSLSSNNKRKARPNPKERAEAMQLERAIRESLNDVKAQQPAPFVSPEPDAKPSIAFQCLLDVTYEEGRASFSDRQKVESCEPAARGDEHLSTYKTDVDVATTHEDGPWKHLEDEPSDSADETRSVGRNGSEAAEGSSRHEAQFLQVPHTAETTENIEKTKVKRHGDSSTSDDLLLEVQSSTTPVQRRVVGLSKRFRPPPLHPYLTS